MARQVPTSAELMQVSNDFETFFLPFDASLDLGSRTTYGTTDPAVDLSMVNIRHLNNTRGFRGIWNTAPTDGNEPVPYREGQVVVGNNSVIYQRTAMNPTTNPNPVGNPDEWQALGTQLTVNRAVDTTTTGGPGLVNTSTTPGVIDLHFRGYTMGNGISIDAEGEISVTNFSLTDIHTFTTVALRNSANTIEWHTGDTAIVTEGVNPNNTGRGTYVYTGGINGNDYTGTTVDGDWTLLELPGNVVTSITNAADVVRTGNITIAQIIGDINAATSQILTDTEYTQNAFKYSGAADPTSTPPSAAGRAISAGDLYVNTMSDTLWFYDGEEWAPAAPATLAEVGDVYLTNPALDHHLVYSPDAGGTGVAGWHNQTPSQITGRNIPLGNLMDVTYQGALANADFLQYDTSVSPARWRNITLADLQAQFDLTDLNDVVVGTDAVGGTTLADNHVLHYNNTLSRWENVTVQTLVGQATTGARLQDLNDVTAATANSEFLRWDGDSWEPVLLSAAANATGTAGIALQNLNDVDDNDNPAENDILVWNAAQGWHPQPAAETAVAELDNIGDVASYATTTTSYIAQAVQENVAFVTTTNIVNIPMDTPFRDDAANPQNVYFVPNNDFITDAGRTSITATTFANAGAVGPFNLTQAVGGNGSLYFHTAADGPAATDIANRINAIAGNAVAVTQRVGPAHPPVGSIIHWVETNQITGAGEWRYETLSTHTNNVLDLDDLRDVNYPNAPEANQALVWNGVDNRWEPRTENTFQVREATFDPLTGGNVGLFDLTRTVVATRAADIGAPNVTRTGTPGNYNYSIRTDSTNSLSTREVQSGDFYVAGNRDLYFASIDAMDNLAFREDATS